MELESASNTGNERQPLPYRSSGRGSETALDLEKLSLGFCKDHARSNEAYCEACRVMICPSCLMFGAHQGHSVLDPTLAAQMIKSRIRITSGSGKLNKEYSERFLLDIRDSKIKLTKAQTVVNTQVKECFKTIISTLKARREEIEDNVYEHFRREGEILDNEERGWEEKQMLGKKLLEFSNSPDDEALLVNSFMILNAIDVLNENNQMKGVELVNSIDLTCWIEGKEVGFASLLRKFGRIGSFGEIKNTQFRL